MPTRALVRLFFLLLLGACPGMAQAPIEEPKLEGEQQQKLQDLPPPPGRFLNVPKETLEEPPPRSVLILIGSQLQRQLPTIRSRAQLIRFSPLPVETVERILLAEGLITDPQQAREAARRSSGSVTQACELADEALAAYRHTLLHALAQPAWDSVGLARNTAQFIEQAGKDQPPRRARARQLVNAALAFYSTLLRAQAQAPSAAPPEILAAAQAALRGGQTDVQATVERLESCLQALEHIDRNVIQANWLEVWFDSLARARSVR